VHIAFSQPDVDPGSVRFVPLDEAPAVVPPVYERARLVRPGMVSRPDFWWPQVFWEFMVGRARPSFVVMHTDADGNDDGYVVYSVTGEGAGGLSDRRLSIIDMQAETPETLMRLWRYVFGVDLIGTVSAHNVAIDDPLRHIVVDGRYVRVDYVNDHLWLAPLDPLALLSARTYTVPGRLVVETHAPDGGITKVAVEATESETHCSDTTDPADLVCKSPVLGMCVLGGNRWSELAAAGRVEARSPAVLARADAMFLATPPPALLSFF